MGFKKFLLNLFFPKDIKCICCSKELSKPSEYCLCDKCINELPYNSQFCKKCGNPLRSLADFCLSCKKTLPKFEQAVAPFVYKDKVIALIHNLKYNNSRFLTPYLSKILFDAFIKTKWKVDLVYPVPLFEKREKKRGYNQAELLCDEFKNKGYTVDKTNLVRIKNTPTQTDLSFEERQISLDNAFSVLRKKEVKNKNVLIVDDVFTTGSTLNHCTEKLLKAGADKVFCLTLAHVENFKVGDSKNVKNTKLR